nr:hypothetical protein [Theobroma cacao]
MPGRRATTSAQRISSGDSSHQRRNTQTTGDTEVPVGPPGTNTVASLRRIHRIRMEERGEWHFSHSNNPDAVPEDSQILVDSVIHNRFEIETIISNHLKQVKDELAGLSLVLFSAKDFFQGGFTIDPNDATRAQRIEEIEVHLRPIREFLLAREEEYLNRL